MKKSYVIFVLIFLMGAGVAVAEPVSQERAREIAAQFLAGSSSGLKLSARAPMAVATPATQQSAFYVFNSVVADRGFVIVAGDDRLPAVLGYSDSGSFDADDVPPAMQQWLDGYAAQVEAIAAGAAPEVRTALRLPIAPLLPVQWGQGVPYNILLPHVDGSSYPHAYVGCVATAMAQIMAYWQYPPRPTATIPGYTSDDGTVQVTMPSLEPVDFDWENMKSAYYVNDTTSAASMAVANLMLYCSTSLLSAFSKSSTTANFNGIPEALMTYFGYKNTAHYIVRNSFTTQSWEDAIYDELWLGCPVAYSGSKLSAGHAFVCDGYDGEGRFHINWGWEGKSNGYFFLNLLNPDDEGIGSAAGNYSYVKGQMAVVGIVPDGIGDEGTATLGFEQLAILSSTRTRTNSYFDFSVTLSGQFVNNTNVTSLFQPAWGLFNLDGNLVKTLCELTPTAALGFRDAVKETLRTLNFGKGITSGTYLIKPIYRVYPGADNYIPCIGADVNYIEVTISEKSCTVEGRGMADSAIRYTVESCTTSGTLNHGKPLTVQLKLTNTGSTANDLIYMLVNGKFAAMGLANFGIGETGDIIYRYTPSTAGPLTLTFSLNQSGSRVFYTREVTIDTMPSAKLDVSYHVLNVTDEQERVITADRYSIIADVTNTGTEAYDEDFTVRLFRITDDVNNTGSEVLSQSKRLSLPVGASASLQFDFDHDLVDGWKYYCYLCYYSNGMPVGKNAKWYYINLTDDPMVPTPRYSVITHTEPVDGGTVRITSSHTFVDGKIQAGETVIITPVVNPGWLFSSMTVMDSIGNPVNIINLHNGSYTLVMPEGDIYVTVNWVSMPRVLTDVRPGDGGSVQLSGNFVADDKIRAGETVTVSPNPNSGWSCSGVTVVDTIGNPVDVIDAGDGNYTFVMPKSDVIVAVNFEPMPHVNADASPGYGGEVQLTASTFEDDMFKVGEAVTVIPKPNTGWKCSGVCITDSDGHPVEASSAGDGTFTFVMPQGNVNMTVNFERSTGSLFELIQDASGITAGVPCILVNRNQEKVMKQWSDGDTIFQSQDIMEWLDESMDVVRVDDEACFFTMSQISDTIVKSYTSQTYTALYMTNSNGYITLSDNSVDVVLQRGIVPKSRAWLRFAKRSNIPIHLICFSTAYLWDCLSYDNEYDNFKSLRTVFSSTNPKYVLYYKLVEAYGLRTDFDSARGVVAITGGMVDGTAQRGETVEFAVTPATGYITASVQVTTASGEIITTSQDVAKGTYSFIMPAEGVTIKATFDVAADPELIPGDVDLNGKVDIADLTTLIDCLLGTDLDIDLTAADVNRDGIIGIADVTALIDLILSIN